MIFVMKLEGDYKVLGIKKKNRIFMSLWIILLKLNKYDKKIIWL